VTEEEEEEEQLEEELDEDLLLEDQEEEIDVDAEVEGIELEDPVVSLKVSWSGRGNPSAEINVKGSGSSFSSFLPSFYPYQHLLTLHLSIFL